MCILRASHSPCWLVGPSLAAALAAAACSQTTEADACWQAEATRLAAVGRDAAGDWRADALFVLDSLEAAGATVADASLFFYNLYGSVERAWMASQDSVLVVYDFFTLPNVIVVSGPPAALRPLVPYERLQLMEVSGRKYAELECR